MIVLLILTALSIPLLRIKSKFILFTLIGCILLSLFAGHKIGWQKLEARLENVFIDNLSERKHIYELANTMINSYVLSNIQPSPYGSGPGSFETVLQFELNEQNARWESWCHNDYLETLLTFGIPGAIVILIIFTLQPLILFLKLIYSRQGIFYYFAIISFLGILVHAAVDFPFQVYSIFTLVLILLSSAAENTKFYLVQNN